MYMVELLFGSEKITLSRISIKNKIFMVERQMAQTWDRSYEHLTLNASMRYP